MTSRTVSGFGRVAEKLDHLGQVPAGVLQVGLDDDAGLHLGELGLLEQLADQPEGEVLDVVVLGVEVDEGAARLGLAQDRAEAGLGLFEAVGAR